MKPYNRFSLLNDEDGWSRKSDFERRQRTNYKGCQYIVWHNLKTFALSGSELSETYLAVPKSWSQYGAHRALSVLNPALPSYLTDEYCNGSAASLLPDRIAKAEYVVLSLGAFLQAVHNGPASRFALD